jgi:EAL domain-containing protein (putative c-di-GMP-specific phosphodiesterase class I)
MNLTEIIDSVIEEYRELGVFKEWLNSYTASLFTKAFDLMCREDADSQELRSYGQKLYIAGAIPSSLLLIVEKMHAYLPVACIPLLSKNKHILAHAYLSEKMLSDRRQLNHLIRDTSGLRYTTDNSVTAIAHLRWLKQWIDARLDGGDEPPYDPDCCEVGEWIRHSLHRYIIDPERRHGFINDHRTLHTIAQDTRFFFDRGEHLYALELYLDLRSYTLRLREQFNFLFLREKLELFKIDPLTGLKNRFNLMDDLENHQKKCFVLLNIHDFSKMNMLYGKGYGDEILINVANTLRKYIPEEHIYRFYADEFSFIVNPETCPNFPSLLRKIESDIGRNERVLAAVTFYGAYGTIDDTIFDRCEYAIMSRHQKHERIINADLISADEIERFTDNLTISQKLRIALANDKIVPYYQPLVSSTNGTIIRYEALMRVIDENGNVLVPGEFLKVLEPMYIYPECTKTLCKKVFETFDKRPEEFSINFAITDIYDDDTRLFLFALFKKYPAAARRCTIELLANEAVIDNKRVNDFFNLLKQHDVKCALDDFGAGFSNFAYLFHLHIDYIKIDNSIIQSLDDPKMMQLAQTIVEMAHNLNIQTVAEFVSEEHWRDVCQKIGIDLLQGYLPGFPAPLEPL